LLALRERIALVAGRAGAVRSLAQHLALSVDATHTSLQAGVAAGSVRRTQLVGVTVCVIGAQRLDTALAGLSLVALRTQAHGAMLAHTTESVGAAGTGSARVLALARETRLVHGTVTGHPAATLASSVLTHVPLRTGHIGGAFHAADTCHADLTAGAVLVG